MAGTVTVRCDGCRRPVMVADRDGQIGNAWGSLVVTDPGGVPVATCALCNGATPWKPRGPMDAPLVSSSWPLADAHARNGSICEEVGHDPLDASLPVRSMIVQRTCQRCGSVYQVFVAVGAPS